MARSYKILLFSIILFFIFIQLERFLNLGFLSFVIIFVEVGLFIFFSVSVVFALYQSLKNNHLIHKIVTLVCTLFLIAIICKPRGFITDELVYGENIMYVYNEGVAGCASNLKFKRDGKYFNESICFGRSLNRGNYTYRNDTLYFDTLKINQYKYGVINRKDSLLLLFLNNPLTNKDFESIDFDSTIINKKIEKSKTISFKIKTLNGI